MGLKLREWEQLGEKYYGSAEASRLLGMAASTLQKLMKPAKEVSFVQYRYEPWPSTSSKHKVILTYRFYDKEDVNQLQKSRDAERERIRKEWREEKIAMRLKPEDVSVPSSWWRQARRIKESLVPG